MLLAGVISAMLPVLSVQAHDDPDRAAKMKAAREKAAAAAAAQTEGPRNIFDGVYTVEQAERGKKLYTEFCATCHGAKGGGGPGAPAMTGSAMNNREGTTMFDLFEYLVAAMPPDNPGYLRDREYTDVLAYVLELHGAPAGDAELAPTEEGLSAVEIISKP